MASVTETSSNDMASSNGVSVSTCSKGGGYGTVDCRRVRSP